MMLRPHFDNARGQGDRISNAANLSLLAEAESDEPYVDRSCGYSWNFTPKLGAAVYGRTEALPPSPIDHLARDRFLRVPFRRVPVIGVHSANELSAFAARIISGDPSMRVMWRGQNEAYCLPRTEEELLRLFGSTDIREPSLLSSAARRKVEFSQVFPPWSAVLDMYLSERARALTDGKRFLAELADFRASYRYRLWAFATAQHYGLPSVGLDLTSDLWTAVSFALQEMRIGAMGATTISRVPPTAKPILYAIAVLQNDLFEDEKLVPGWLQCARPKAQAAHFFGTGWGDAPNKAAERIFVAFRLLNHETWTLPKSVSELFPPAKDDLLLEFLLRARARFPEIADEAYLHRVYYVA